jgi:hypothetical protein
LEVIMSRLVVALVCVTQFVLSPLVEITANARTQSRREDRRVGSITGRITGDGGQPIVGAGVFVRKTGTSSGVGRTIVTDEEGRFHVDELPLGTYFVGANSPGYVPATEFGLVRYYRLGDIVTIRLTKGGVITGAVTTATGEPVVAARVNATRVRDTEGRPLRSQGGPSGVTDDRGIYRVYGLQSGTYIVGVNGGGSFYSPNYAYGGEVPVYHPSGTRDAATEVAVVAGQEVTGVDIRYRGVLGHAISGTLAGLTEQDPSTGTGVSISLVHSSTGALHATSFIMARDSTRNFAVYGVPDGEYVLTAQFLMGGEGSAASQPRRVAVKGSDVTGVQLSLIPLGLITGRLTLESLTESERKSDCKEVRTALLEEAMVMVRRDQKGDKERQGDLIFSLRDGAPNEKGEFVVEGLAAGRYHIGADLPEDWFVRKITTAGVTPAKPPIDVSKDGVAIAAGQRLGGLSMEVSEGAAGLRGRLVSDAGKKHSMTKNRVHLVPAEPESADNALRFYEAVVDSEGGFTLTNLAPGRYFIIARALTDDEWSDRAPRRASWDQSTRSALLRDAKAANAPVEIQRCQRVPDLAVKYSPPPSTKRAGSKNSL